MDAKIFLLACQILFFPCRKTRATSRHDTKFWGSKAGWNCYLVTVLESFVCAPRRSLVARSRAGAISYISDSRWNQLGSIDWICGLGLSCPTSLTHVAQSRLLQTSSYAYILWICKLKVLALLSQIVQWTTHYQKVMFGAGWMTSIRTRRTFKDKISTSRRWKRSKEMLWVFWPQMGVCLCGPDSNTVEGVVCFLLGEVNFKIFGANCHSYNQSWLRGNNRQWVMLGPRDPSLGQLKHSLHLTRLDGLVIEAGIFSSMFMERSRGLVVLRHSGSIYIRNSFI